MGEFDDVAGRRNVLAAFVHRFILIETIGSAVHSSNGEAGACEFAGLLQGGVQPTQVGRTAP